MTDEERLTWLEDQLWNGWEVDCWAEGRKAVYQVSIDELHQAPTLREAIDKAMESES